MGMNDKLFRKLAPSQYRNFKTFKIMENMYGAEHGIVITFAFI